MHLKQCDSKRYDEDKAATPIIPPMLAGHKVSVTPNGRRLSFKASWRASYSQRGVSLHAPSATARQRCWLVMWPLQSVDTADPLHLSVQSATLQFAWLRMVHVIGNPNRIAHPMTQVCAVAARCPLPAARCPLPASAARCPLPLPQSAMLATAPPNNIMAKRHVHPFKTGPCDASCARGRDASPSAP